MKELKVSLSLIVLGNLLYLAFIIFSGNETSDFDKFTSGLLIGLSLGCNLVGIILTVAYMARHNKKEK